jgi:hypothetical protein
VILVDTFKQYDDHMSLLAYLRIEINLKLNALSHFISHMSLKHALSEKLLKAGGFYSRLNGFYFERFVFIQESW